jgi:hypothetical protein
MALGLTSSLQSKKLITPGIVTDNLVLKHKYDAGSVVPVSDGAVYFDGSGDYIDTGYTFQTEIRGSYSVGMWLKPLDGGSTDAMMGARNASIEDWWYIGYNAAASGDSILYHKSNGTADIGYSDSPQFSATKTDWMHIAWSVTKSAVGGFKTYVNGALVGTANSNGISEADWEAYTSDVDMFLGSYSADGAAYSGYVGYMCNAFFYSAAIEQPQIKSIMNKNYAGLTSSEKTNLVSWWNLSADANDSHGSNNGTIV